MKIAIQPDCQFQTFHIRYRHISVKEKKINFVDYKLYQKLFVILVSFSTILIFPDSQLELGKICENYNSTKSCNVW